MIQYVIAAAALLLCHAAIPAAIRRWGWAKENFRKDKIPAVFGLYIVAYGVSGAIIGRYSVGFDPADRLYLVAVLGFGALGFADDVLGSREIGGFRGHFRRLILERRMTTGAAKAIGGGLIALYLGWRASGGSAGLWVLDSVLIALAANIVNLLDLRPGRAIFVFFVGMLIVAGATRNHFSAPAVLIAVAFGAGWVAIYDSRGLAMLGDVGSNVLGAVLGLTLALDAPLAAKVAAAVVFLIVNIYSERFSISELIARHPVLAKIDSKLGVR